MSKKSNFIWKQQGRTRGAPFGGFAGYRICTVNLRLGSPQIPLRELQIQSFTVSRQFFKLTFFFILSFAPVLFRVAAVVFLFVLVHLFVSILHCGVDIIVTFTICCSECKTYVIGAVSERFELRYQLFKLLFCDVGTEYHKFITACTVYLVISE